MKRLTIAAAFIACIIISFGTQDVSAAQHRFIAIDEGLGNLLYVNEYDSATNWIVPVNRKVGTDSIYAPRDMQLVGNNRILIGHTHGYTEYNLTTGAVVRDLLVYDSVSSVRRLPGGQTLIFGVNLDGSTGVVMLKLDSLNAKIKKVVYPGTYVRLVRQTNTGTFLMACNDTIKEADTSGTFIWKTYLPGTPTTNKHMWKIVRLDNGNVFVAAGYGAFLAEVNSSGTVVRKIGAAPQPAGVNPYFYGMFQILANRDIVVANWQGHGTGHGSAGIELLEFDTTGTVIWQWNKFSIISSLQGVLVLDSLNTALLYDDRNGIMKPLTTTAIARDFTAQRRPRTSASRRINIVTGAPSIGGKRHNLITLSGKTIRETSKAGSTSHSGSGVYLNKTETDGGSRNK